jgi:hypothetical protein
VDVLDGRDAMGLPCPPMLWALIKQTEWKPFLDLLSPSFFRVVPAGPLLAELRRLAALYRNADTFERAVALRGASLARARLPIEVTAAKRADPPPQSTDDAAARARGQRVLELFFHQVFDDGLTLLDLRQQRFTPSEAGDGALLWSPSGAMADWSPEFRGAVRALYRGFYNGDDRLFREGLSALGLSRAEEALRRQFGEGQQREVHFTLRDFQQKFHEVFVRCQETGSTIDTGFLALGLYLATLYEHLDALAQPFDARAAFEVATARAP